VAAGLSPWQDAIIQLFSTNQSRFGSKQLKRFGLIRYGVDENMPRVTVIIPTYNRAVFLKEAIDSVLDQDFRDFELIVVDDGSTDSTLRLLRSYRPSIRIIKTQRKGVSAARNTGIEQAKGSYIAFLDSDDLYVKNKLSVQMAYVEAHPEAKICYTDEIWIRKGVRVNPKKSHAKHSGWIFDKCLPLCIISPSSVMMSKELLDEVGVFDESMPVCEDYDLWLRIAVRYPVHFIEKKLIIKRGGHHDQLSSTVWGKDRYRIQALRKILSSPHLTPQERGEVLETIRSKCRIVAGGCKKRGKRDEQHYYESLLTADEYRLSRL
jgi:glycosyltransferase involved in cell wall biosynthesis